MPTGQAFLPLLVAEEHFPNAVAWTASVLQAAMVLGPVAGGLFYGAAASPVPVYACAAMCSLTGLALISPSRPRVAITRAWRWASR